MQLTLISAAIAGVIGFGTAWQLQAGNISKIHLEAANERISSQRAARHEAERRVTTVITAQSNAASRAPVLRAAADASRGELDRLRESTASALRAATGSLDACNSVVAAHGAVLAESSGQLQEVARDADQCFSDLALMREAWPN